MRAKKFGKILVVLILFFLSANTAQAGFGFSPGSVKNKNLSPGSHFEQTITFSRYSPKGDLKMEIIIDAPKIKDWISIDKGLSFIFPDGKQQTSIVVSVDVPKDAAYGEYNGFIRVKAIPVGEGGEGAVSVIVGADIGIILAVTKEKFSDFKIQTFSIKGIEKKNVQVSIRLENLGNIPVAPTKVHLEVSDQYFNLLYSGDTSDLEKVPSFATAKTIAVFPFQLEKGYYWGKVQIFKGDEVVKSGDAYFEVTEKKFFSGITEIGGNKWVIIAIAIFIIFIIGGAVFWAKFRQRRMWGRIQRGVVQKPRRKKRGRI
jgi:hypothetical protein